MPSGASPDGLRLDSRPRRPRSARSSRRRSTTWWRNWSPPSPEGLTQPDAASPRRIAALALPALGVLAAEPIYLLFDIAVVGRLGVLPLAGLAIGGLILSVVSSQLTFLSYGTTARSARFYGAGDRTAAVGEGVQATWLALGLGGVVLALGLVAAVVLSPFWGGLLLLWWLLRKRPAATVSA